TGDADLDEDGFIDVAELYLYIFRRISEAPQSQFPIITQLGVRGDHLVLARSSKKKKSQSIEPQIPFPFVGPIGSGGDEHLDLAQTGGNAYTYENCHIVSAWNLAPKKRSCRVAIIAGKADQSHPALRGVDIAEQRVSISSDLDHHTS